MPVARIIMMQKNEGDMLIRWLSHYASIFGPENITIMDNGSDDGLTLSILKLATSCGINVIWGYDTQHDFVNKGGHFKNIIMSWDNDIEYDFAIPVDCDEIIGVFKNDRISLKREDIMQELQALVDVKSSLRIDMSLFNVPNKSGWFSPDRSFHKGFLAAKTICDMDNGHHAPTSRIAPGFQTTRLTYLHYHNRPFAEMQRLSRIKLGYRIKQDFTTEVLEDYIKVAERPGSHLIKGILMDEVEYSNMYNKSLQIYIPDADKEALFKTTQIFDDELSHVWTADGYLKNNPDVNQYGLGPLHHYVRCGWLEGRKLIDY